MKRITQLLNGSTIRYVRKFVLWATSLPLLGGLGLVLVCAFLDKDFSQPGRQIAGGLIFGMFWGLILSAFVHWNPTMPGPPFSKTMAVIFFSGFTMALGFGLSEVLGVGFGSRFDRTVVDLAIMGAICGFWVVVMSIDSQPAIRQILRPGLSLPTISLLILVLIFMIWQVPPSATEVLPNLVGGVIALALGFHLGIMIGKGVVPVWTIIVTETKQPLRYLQLLWRPIIAFVLIYLILVVLFAAVYSTLYHHYGNHLFAFPGREAGAPLGFADFVYFSLVTITTVGYGDLYPTHSLTRIVVAIEVLVGIAWIVVYFALMMKYLEETATKPQN